MKLSLIIPMYNVELYIERCLRSCLCQDIPVTDYEIICINDGSPDNSEKIAKQYKEKYSNIVVINQENKGLSGARNTGIKEAKGDYVWFVDADDWIENNCLGAICSKLDDDIDLLQIEYRKTYDNESLNTPSIPNPIDGIVDGFTQTIKGGLHTPAQFVLCRREYLNTNCLRFKEGIYHEDGEFRPRSILPAKRISSLDKICYNYYQRQTGSIMSSFKEKNVNDIFLVMNELYNLANTQETAIKIALYTKLGSYFNTMLYGIYTSKKIEYSTVRNQFKNKKHLFKAILSSRSLKYKIESLAFLINIDLGYKLYSLIR